MATHAQGCVGTAARTAHFNIEVDRGDTHVPGRALASGVSEGLASPTLAPIFYASSSDLVRLLAITPSLGTVTWVRTSAPLSPEIEA